MLKHMHMLNQPVPIEEQHHECLMGLIDMVQTDLSKLKDRDIIIYDEYRDISRHRSLVLELSVEVDRIADKAEPSDLLHVNALRTKIREVMTTYKTVNELFYKNFKR